MNWITDIIRMLFPSGKRIKVDPDHLPGLRSPRSGVRPPTPPPQSVQPPDSDIEGIYARFQERERPAKPSKHERGVGF